jgi:two-component system invasion response regulator UvrY
MSQVRVLAVDDQDVFLRAAHAVVDAADGFTWAGGAVSGREAIRLINHLCPDLALVDLRMPGLDGLETSRRLLGRDPDLVVVLVSIESPDDVPAATRSCGAVAYLRKQELSPVTLRDVWATHARGGRGDAGPTAGRRCAGLPAPVAPPRLRPTT